MASDKKGARRRGATLVFWDEAGFSQLPPVRATWAKRGFTPVLRARLNRDWLSAIGMLLYSPQRHRLRLLFSLRKGTVNSQRVIAVLRELRRHVRGPVVLLWDGLGGHISKLTQGFLATQRHWLTVERFPSYAPELNPVEYLWANLGAGEKAHFAPDTLGELAEEVPRRIDAVARQPHLLRAFLQHSRLYRRL